MVKKIVKPLLYGVLLKRCALFHSPLLGVENQRKCCFGFSLLFVEQTSERLRRRGDSVDPKQKKLFLFKKGLS